MRNEKPGGHGERSVAVGVVDMALHDLAAKVAGVPLYRWISDHYGDGGPDDSVFVYAAGGYYAPGKTDRDLQDEMQGFLDAGYEVVKMKIGGADLAEDLRRIEAVIEVLDGDGSRLAVDVNGTLRPRHRAGVRPGPRPLRPVLVRGGRRPARLPASTPRSPSTTATRSRPGRTCSRSRTPATSSATAACGPTATTSRSTRPSATGSSSTGASRTCSPSTAGPRAVASRTAVTSSPCTSRPPSSSAATSPTPGSSSPPAASPTTPSSRTAGWRPATAPASASRARPTSTGAARPARLTRRP